MCWHGLFPAALITGGVLQLAVALSSRRQSQVLEGAHDLVFAHVPFNFGNTVARVALLGPGSSDEIFGLLMKEFGWFNKQGATPVELDTGRLRGVVQRLRQPGAEAWGHFDAELVATSEVTGCPLYLTPQKYWPTEVAERYFGNRTVFGLLRDPFERLVAMFRGNVPGYGGQYEEPGHRSCDVDSAVRSMVESYLAGDRFANSCTFLPQAEFFDGPHGITLPVDNRRFPDSMNEVLEAHGYHNMHIGPKDIFHVSACRQSWAGDLKPETRRLIRQAYARDLELLCEHFGYCTPDENTCITGVPEMCPENVTSM